MKQTVRLNTFETNSSSVHALALCKENIESKSIDILSLSMEVIPDGEFDWGYEVLDSITDKLKYIYQVAIATENEYAIGQLKDLLPNCEFVDDEENGYVDHGYDKGDILNYALANFQDFIDKGIIILSNDSSEFRETFESTTKKHNATIVAEGGN